MADRLNYSGVALDRAANFRRDEGWVAERLADPKSRVVPVWRSRNLIAVHGPGIDAAAGIAPFAPGAEPPEAVVLTGDRAGAILEAAGHVVLLGVGTDDGTAYVAADVSDLDEITADELAPQGTFEDLRRFGVLMAAQDAALLAYARGILHWHRRHVFCGICGAPTESHDGGHVLKCANADDPHVHFPRTDPAVIMLIAHDDPDGRGPACLLGHQSRWADGMYSTLAGFVEPGETLEEAVIREVFEETGVKATDARYMASQPWPFPQSLMLGFRARAVTTEITVDPKELADARWWTPKELATFGEWTTAPEGALRLPRKDSISRWLIQGWIDEAAG